MTEKQEFPQLLVEVKNPKAFDETVQSLGAVVVQSSDDPSGYQRVGDAYVIICMGDPGFIEFVIQQQGYGRIVGKRYWPA